MLLRTMYERNQMNLMVNCKGNSAKCYACASSNICRMPHMVTVWSVEPTKKPDPVFAKFVRPLHKSDKNSCGPVFDRHLFRPNVQKPFSVLIDHDRIGKNTGRAQSPFFSFLRQ
jgi:hypothetical protein